MIGTINVLLVRRRRGSATAPSPPQCAARIGTVLFVAACAWWVRKHEDFSRAIKEFMNEGRDYTAQQRSAR